MSFRTLHRKIGDFWWYSLLLFLALRFGDVINAFAGLWLVPHYVPQEELGAVPALLQASNLFGFPLLVLVFTFTKYLNRYATLGEKGKVKAILHSFWVFSVIFSLLSTLIAYSILPHFFERLRIVSGSLGILIVASGILTTLSPIFINALQALKKFNVVTLINLLGAPFRLLVLLVAMPIRALSGYLLGQALPALAMISIAYFSLHRELDRRIETRPFWKEDGRDILKYTGLVAIWMGSGAFCTALEMVVIRQRLPEVESAGYYMISRLAEIGSFLGMTLSYVMFPLAAEAHTQGKESLKLLAHMILGTLATGALCILGFAVAGKWVFSSIPSWSPYTDYVGLLVLLTATLVLRMVTSNFVNYEIAYNRFSFLWYGVPLLLLQAGILLSFCGYSYFYGILPDGWVDWMGACRMARLDRIIQVWFLFSLIGILGNGIHIYIRLRRKRGARTGELPGEGGRENG